MAEITLLFLLGVFSGFVAGLLGVGGGLIIVPALLYLLAESTNQAVLMHSAIGTALAVIVFTSISSVWAHHRHNAINWQHFKKLTPTVLLGAFSGAVISKYLSFDFLRIFFAIFEICVSYIMFFNISASAATILNKTVWSIVGYIIGAVSAIVGIGGGTMTTPFLIYNKVNIKNAIATSAAIGMPIAVAGSVGFFIAGQSAVGSFGFINIKALIIIASASVLFAPLGAKVAHSVDSKKLKKFFALFLFSLALVVIAF